MAAPVKKGLGRGLAAMFGDAPPAIAAPAPNTDLRGLRDLPIHQLQPGRYQPRRTFDDAALNELAQSIAERGLLQPILARRVKGSDTYEIVAGERRWRAAQIAKLHHVPVIIKDLTDIEALEVALIENIQRRDLTPTEEAQGYSRLISEFDYTQEELSAHIGKSRSQVANMLRLLSLPEEVQAFLDKGELTVGQVRPLIGRKDAAALAKRIVAEGLNARAVEELLRGTGQIHKPKGGGSAAPERKPAVDADTRALERQLSQALGLKVFVHHKGEAGELIVQYTTLEQLDDLVLRLSRTPPQEPDEDPL